jgi:hypothetical protein
VLHQAGQSLVKLVDDQLLAFLADGEVDGRRPGTDPEVLGPRDGTGDGGGLQELLRGYAPAVQT